MKTRKNGIRYNILLLVMAMCFVFEVFPQRAYNPTVTGEITDEEIIWADADFEKRIRKILSKPSGTIWQSDLDTITELDLNRLNSNNSKISDIVHFKNLRTLNLYMANINDISVLANLPNLTELNLAYTDIIDISVLANLPNLTELDLSVTDISDISVLANLPNLTKLNLFAMDDISDISAVAKLSNLTELDLSGNNGISDISALASLTNLTKLDLPYNISDISVLASLTNMTTLDLSPNVSDISALANLPNLSTIFFGFFEKHSYATNNNISDWSPVSHVENVYGKPRITEEIDGKPYYIYERKGGYTLWNTNRIFVPNDFFASVNGIWNHDYEHYDTLFKLVYMADYSGKTAEEWEELELILHIKNKEGKILTLDYKNLFYDESYVNNKSIDMGLYPHTDYMDVLLRSIFDEGRGYYVGNEPQKLNLFRFDFKTETVSLLSEATMSLSVAELLGGQFPTPSEAYKFYEYAVKKTLTEEMNFLPANEELEFYDYGSTDDLLVYEVEKNQVTLRRDKILTDGDLYFFNQLILEDVEIITKSVLQEGATLYSAENMKEFDNNMPWVSGMQDITHEEIVLESETYLFERLIIGNGFYREDRLDLFLANNRVKEIQILYEGHENSIKHYVILEDTELKQSIPLLYADSKKITIKILSVYPGTEYNDTCINYFVGVRDYNADYYNSIPTQGDFR